MLIFLACNFLSDYICFTKTRTFVATLRELKSPCRGFVLLFVDLLLSAIIVAVVSISVASLIFYFYAAAAAVVAACTIFAIVAVARKLSIVGLVVPNVVIVLVVFLGLVLYCSVGNANASLFDFIGVVRFLPGAFILPIITGMAISLFAVVIACIEIVKRMAFRIESGRIWQVLNFEPTESSAVILIVLFTLVYWPIVLNMI